MSVRLRAVPALLILALVLGGCQLTGKGHTDPAAAPGTSSAGTTLATTGASPGSDTATTLVGHGTTTTRDAVRVLAGVGIATVGDLDSHAGPIVPVASPRVSTMTLSQVQVLARQASAGGGMTGASLDGSLPLGDGAPTITQIIGAWIVSAPDTAARTAGTLVGTVDWTRPADVVLPLEVLDLFAGDMTQSVEVARGEPSSSAGGGGAGGGGALSLDTPCTSLTGFISSTLDKIFDALEINPQQVQDYIDGHVGGFVGTLLGWLGRIGASIVDGLVDILHATVQQVVDTFTAVVISRLQVVIGSVYAVAQILAWVTPHTVLVTPQPAANRVAVGTEPDQLGTFTATVPGNDETAGLPKQMVDCGNFAHVHPPTVTRAGAAVHWVIGDPAHIAQVIGPAGPPYNDVMGPDISDALRYRTGRVQDRTGQQNVAPLQAAVSVQRSEVQQLREMLDAALDANLGILAPLARKFLSPLLDLVESKLAGLIDIAGHSVIPVLYWGARPTPSTPACPSGGTIPAGTYRGDIDAQIDTREMFNVQGHRLLAASARSLARGRVILQSDGTEVSGSIRLTGTSEGTGAADFGVPLRVHGTGTLGGPVSGSAGKPRVRLTASGSWTDNDPLGGQHAGQGAYTDTVGLHVVTSNCVSVTGDVTAMVRELYDHLLGRAATGSDVGVKVTVSGPGRWVAVKG